MAYTVPAMLTRPLAIFEGIRWDEDDDDGEIDGWLCYCGRPDKAFLSRDEHASPPPDGEVFLVFVNKERVVYGWRWYKADPFDADLPVDHEKRYIHLGRPRRLNMSE